MIKMRKNLSFFVVLLLSLLPAYGVTAQDIVATPVPGTVPVGVLAEFDIDELPGPHTEVWFMRFQLEPEGLLPVGTSPGPQVLYVEVGTIVVKAEGTVIPSDTVAVDTSEFTLKPGDSLLVPRDVPVEVSNTADEPARFLVLLMYGGMDEDQVQAGSEEPVGLTSAGITVGVAEFMPVPATLTMERVVVEPGETMQNIDLENLGPGPGWMGMDLGTVETGSADLLFEKQSIDTIIWPAASPDSFPEPDRVRFTANGSVEQGESYAVYGSVVTFTNTGDEPLTILRVIVTPHMGE